MAHCDRHLFLQYCAICINYFSVFTLLSVHTMQRDLLIVLVDLGSVLCSYVVCSVNS
jgi:hypothetical protein